jgi:hypothetical protein
MTFPRKLPTPTWPGGTMAVLRKEKMIRKTIAKGEITYRGLIWLMA